MLRDNLKIIRMYVVQQNKNVKNKFYKRNAKKWIYLVKINAKKYW